MKQQNELIAIHSVGTLIEAETLKAYLNSQDIAVYMKSESLGRISGLMSGPLSEVVLFVPVDKAAKAKKLQRRVISKNIIQFAIQNKHRNGVCDPC